MHFIKNPKIRWKYVLIVVLILASAIGGGILWSSVKQEFPLNEFPGGNDRFRNLTIQFVRTVAETYFETQTIQYPEELEIRGDWEVYITIYHQGEIKGEGTVKKQDEMLSLALEEATLNVIKERHNSLNKEDIKDVRFLISFPYDSDQSFSFIEYNGEGKELIENLVIIRDLDKDLITQKIEQGKEFLLRAMHKDEYGFYKKYDTLNDDFGDRLHTVYSASIIYTLLKIYDFDKDERIMEGISKWGDFLLTMQSKDNETYGAFHYTYYPNSGRKEPRFVVGTTALSIFTLLDLYNRTDNYKYLESAKLGGNWLITMQKSDGWMKAYKQYINGEWIYGEKRSLLYNGQVLSALSRLYIVTGEKRYYNAAEKIAQRFTEKVEREGCYLGDEYRTINPISSAWVIMSLLDFYKVNQDDYYKNVIFKCSSELLTRQKQNEDDILYYGTFERAYSTSGMGWLAEVMMEMDKFCREQNTAGCDKYKEAVIKVILWIIQNTYTEENTFFLKEPHKAIGGIFWNYEERYVRTDSVCHGINAYVDLINDLEDGLILSIPEKPIEVILKELKK